jgi:hypothetical protein
MNQPAAAEVGAEAIEIRAGAQTDLFRDPGTSGSISNAPVFYRAAPAEFTVGATVSPGFGATYDAGAIVFWLNEESWVKLAFEYTDLGYPAIVSVVTRERSDDCNGERMREGDTVALRVSRREGLLGLYYAVDGGSWKMHRLLSLAGAAGVADPADGAAGADAGDAEGGAGGAAGVAVPARGPGRGQQMVEPRIGLSAQSPTGQGCTVRFTDLSWDDAAVRDFRAGV